MIDNQKKLAELATDLNGRSKPPIVIQVSMGTCGIAAGTTPVLEKFKEEIANKGVGDDFEIVETGCMGLCHSEPTIRVIDTVTGDTMLYGNVNPESVEHIIARKAPKPIAGINTIEKSWYYPEDEKDEFDSLQAKIVLRNTGKVNPEKIDDYIARKGYEAMATALTGMEAEEVIDVITASGLRGRGGGGFPTGKKWSFAAAQKSEVKYMICNADEGDPGAFMDRAVLEGDPHSVLEAMTIAGYAVGANHGIVYIRAEYPLAIKRLELAIDQARTLGLLGKNILGSGFDFDIELKFGAGAFVCGEETALIHSIEGKRGEPTFKPPFPAVSGLWGKPTIVNNVETYANMPAIIRKGADWFRGIGTERTPGTKVFALAGKVDKVGLVEVPMGTSMKDIIFELGGGIRGGKEFKAVQTGGPSGGCIKAENLDTPIEYETLIELGSMMGSGGMIVMDEDDCMVNIAKFFLDFTVDESCGKCTPCRIGNKRLHEMLTKICDGVADMNTFDKLKALAVTIKDTALCGLGQTSPNPVLSTIANFEDEYLAHINDKKCPSGVCKNLISFTINENCVGCTMCARQCPVDCISGSAKQPHVIDQDKCIKCGLCYQSCKFHAIDRH
ncbi:MAG: NADH-quinone oxidoreductase subunit NuoF [Verrucomicrobiota bacterium]|nr:NADH-quinone oxidoreductase subunit NuoF [Verrucomicrobiota bacterium]